MTPEVPPPEPPTIKIPAAAVRPGVVVTGGSQGLGRAITDRLATDGHQVLVVDLNPPDEPFPDGVEYLAGDARDEDLIDTACRAATMTGPLHGFVANAGITRPGPSVDYDRADWELSLGVNLTGVFSGARVARRHMAAGSAMVFLSSIAAGRGFAERAAYSASKSGVDGLIRALAAEWGPAGIRVNGIAPGSIRTAMMQSMIDAGRVTEQSYTRNIPLGRVGDAAEIAAVTAFLLSEGASYVSGAVIPVDGGWAGSGMAAYAD